MDCVFRLSEAVARALRYKLGTGSSEAEDLFENSGARIFLDSKSMLQLTGAELDYRSGLMQSGFVFNNPHVKGTCGCGTSFSA